MIEAQIAAYATLALTLVTAIYVVLTLSLFREAKRTRQDSFRPVLIPAELAEHVRNDYDPIRKPPDAYLYIRNAGTGPALNVVARLDGKRLDPKNAVERLANVFDESRGLVA